MNLIEGGRRTTILPYAGLAVIAALFFIWPIPHTIAIRNLLGLTGLIIFGALAVRSFQRGEYGDLRAPLALYLVLTGWLLVVAVFVSHETLWSLGEIKGQWLKAGLMMILGASVAASVRVTAVLNPVRVATVLVAVLVMHVAYLDVLAIYSWLRTGNMPTRVSGLMEHSAYANHVSNILLVFLTSDAFLRLSYHRPLLLLPSWLLVILIVMALASVLFEMMRNGFVEIAVLLAAILMMYGYENRRRFKFQRIIVFSAVAICLTTVFLYVNVRHDARWDTFVQTIPIALDTKTNKAWMDTVRYPLPKLPDGTEVSHSNYMRIAWLKAGTEIVAAHPLGVGYGRNAFGHAVADMYGGRAGSSHSGLLDFAIGAGIPGALLWCAFLASVGLLAWRRYRVDASPFALVLFLLIVGYSVRMVIDGNMRDHILEQFLFLVGLFAVWSQRASIPEPARA